MKRTPIALFALAVLATLVALATMSKHGVRAVYAQSGCTDATLNANYAFTDTGSAHARFAALKGREVPAAVVGVFTFDGVGNISTRFTLAFDGAIFTDQSSTGTYTVNSDCTGSISFTAGNAAGINFNTVIIGGGAEVLGIHTFSGDTATFDAKKQ